MIAENVGLAQVLTATWSAPDARAQHALAGFGQVPSNLHAYQIEPNVCLEGFGDQGLRVLTQATSGKLKIDV